MRFGILQSLLAVSLAPWVPCQGEKVIISHQTELSSLTHKLALDKGYYSALGLDVELVWYPSGAPQVKAAVEDKSWDMGVAGVVPNIIGGSQGILGVGIAMDQSATNQLMGNAEGVATWPPDSIEGIPIVLSPNSTGDFVVQACLKSQGYDIQDVEFIYAQQAEVIGNMTPGPDGTAKATLGGLWAPNTYKLLDSVNGSETICSGASVYATVTGGHMVRQEFAEEKPMTVAKVLSGWLRAVEFINDDSNKEEVVNAMADFFAEADVILPRSALELDLRLVGLFGLARQLELMLRQGDPPNSQYDIWTSEVGNFMLENGVVTSLEPPATYIDDKYMKMVNDDPQLKDWAEGKSVPALESSQSASTSDSSSTPDSPSPAPQSSAVAFQSQIFLAMLASSLFFVAEILV
ncbi:ABC-type nitrate sulfonate bicarbonate transport [Seminavis robusta]|uniref:ABC-type nitrate sulfonate bicarbonate transport n=1 Tax=Seminavis robusta TaxID=568900 RepID=A0A9N8HCQ5_9STRA|nr:ABC-type nitrate sulfonate bicarbonate transport [Seminavis robusta]|eukprot:Sro327_g118360.1 ABC-type nitrate sulfonate bicarbonate transport (406) ;mRNA; r:37581-39156